MIAETLDKPADEQIDFHEYLSRIPDDVSLEQAEKDMMVNIKKDLDIDYIKSRLACLVILASDKCTQKSGELEKFILKQLSNGDAVEINS